MKELSLLKTYRVKCKYSYALLDMTPTPLDPQAEYFIVGKSPACGNRTIIERSDRKSYLGNSRWIVDMHMLEETECVK